MVDVLYILLFQYHPIILLIIFGTLQYFSIGPIHHKQKLISSIAKFVDEFPHELLNDVTLRILEN